MKSTIRGPFWKLFFVVLATLAVGNAATAAAPVWTQKAVAGDIAYFAFATPARIERYNMATEQWLPSITLTASPTALAVDAGGLVIAYNRAVVTRALDGTGEAGLINMPQDVKGLLLSDSLIFVFSPTYSSPTISSFRRSDRQFVATWSGIYSFGGGFAIAPISRRLFGIDTMTSGGELEALNYNADGTYPTGYPGYQSAGYYYYSSASYPRTYVSPDEHTLILGAGYVFDSTSLVYRASLAGNFDDLAFYGADVPILLRGSKLYAYTNTFLESGSFQLAVTAQAVAVRAGQVYAFAADATPASGVAVTKVAVSSFSAAQPGAAINPDDLSFVPDNVIAAGDGTFFLLSKAYQSIFRWSAATRRYLASYALLGSPSFAAYSPALNRLYTAYSTGRINQIKLDAGSTTEEPFANLPGVARGLQAAGPLIFAMDPSGAWGTHYVFGSDGVLLSSREWNYESQEFIWSPLQQRMYFFRDSQSPNDILYEPIDSNGQLGTPVDSPYHGDYNFIHPIRLSTDETGVLIGSGVVFTTSTLVYSGSLANNIIDAASRENRWISIRSVGTDTQLQVWTQNLLFDRGLTVPRYPLRIFNLPDGRILVLTTSDGTVNSGYNYTTVTNAGGLIWSIVDINGSGSIESSPAITSNPASVTDYRGRPATLTVVAAGTDLTYQWRKNGADINGASSSALYFPSLQSADAGAYTVAVRNSFGSFVSTAATLTVQEPPPPPVITSQPQATTAPLGWSANFNVSATGSSLSYQWRKQGVNIDGATSNWLYFYSISAADYSSYDVVVSNPGGTVTSAAATLSAPPAPTILQQPRAASGSVGGSVSFNISATSSGLSYQWRKDGVPLSGQINSYLTINPITAGDYGTYDVIVTNSAGTVTSAGATLSAYPTARLVNLSVRTDLAAGQTLIIGFVTNSGSKDVLVRAAGPYLSSLNVGLSGLPDPRMSVYNGANLVTQNDDWSPSLTATFAQLGAGPFQTGSKDAALLFNVTSTGISTRTAVISGVGAGTVLVEAYDANTPTATRLVNVSTRNFVGTGDGLLIAGFVIDGTGTKQVLIRGLGPALAKYGVTNVLSDPVLTIYRGSDAVSANDNWSAGLLSVFSQVGASALDLGSADAAILLTLSPGVYTAHLTGKNGAVGEGLIELYEVQ